MKKIYFAAMGVIMASLFTACSKSDTPSQEATAEEPAATVISPQFANMHVCTELYPDGTVARGATIKTKQWPNGSTITVSLNGGNDFVRNKVIAFAKEWEKYANIKFNFVTNDRGAQLRVGFVSGGSWSYIGTDANYIRGGKATMNFGWFNNATSDQEFSRTTIHEFGHALGMIHEHQHPLADIPWDKPLVYQYYKETQGWSTAQVDANLFQKYSTSQTNFSEYDRTSIMHYAVEEELTIGNYSVGWNTVLSSTDKAFISTVYP